MDAFPSPKLFGFRMDNKQPVYHKKTQEGNDFGFYPSQQRRAPFTKENWTCENESYRFPINESPKDPWERCFEVVDRADEELYKELKDEISWLLIVASLFLGIVTAFSIMSFGWLRADDRKVSVALLGDIVKLLNDTNARGTVPPRDVATLNFHPRHSDIVINQMWFLSMTLSLSAVVVGTLCLQWLSTFRRKEIKQRSYDDALALRQLRFEGLMGWGVPYVPGFLLLAVQGALVLFAIGLINLLWSVNKQVAIPVVVVGGMAAFLLTVTTVMPLLQSVIGWMLPSTLIIPQCPYKSPVSWVLHRGCVLLSIIVTLPFSLLPRFGKVMTWRGSQIKLLTDYTWQIFDDLWRHQRECRGPHSSETGSRKYSYYLVHGLGSAMEKLVFQPNAIHIIHSCLQDFYGTTAEKETFQGLFGKESSVVKQALAEYEELSTNFRHMFDDTSQLRLSISHKRSLRRDFLNAHSLQHFASQNQKLHRALLAHRVELYIRIKNSSRHFDLPCRGGLGVEDALSYAESRYIGTSTKCPIQNIRDAEALPSELRRQVLNFAKWYLDSDRCERSDADAIKCVLEASQKLQTVYGAQADDADEPPLEDRMKRVLKLLDGHLTEKSHHKRQSSSSVNEGQNGAPLDCKLNQGNGYLADFDVPADENSSADPMKLYEVVRGKLEKYEQRMKVNQCMKSKEVDPATCREILPC